MEAGSIGMITRLGKGGGGEEAEAIRRTVAKII